MKRTFFRIFLIIFIVAVSTNVYGKEPTTNENDIKISGNVDTLKTEDMDNFISDETELDYGFKELTKKILAGEINLSPMNLLKQFLEILFSDMNTGIHLVRNMILISILSAFLNLLTDSFKAKEVSSLGFYVCYIALVIILFDSFTIAYGILLNVINNLYYITLGAIPIILGSIALTGKVAHMYTMAPSFLFFTNFVIFIIKAFLLPALMTVASIEILNYLTEKESLTVLTKNLRSGILYLVKGMGTLFIFFLTFQRIATPSMSTILAKSAKITVGAIPIFGQILAGAVDTVLYLGGMTKNAAMVAILIVTIIACAVPIIKLLLLMMCYKLTAIVIEPISNTKIVKCIDCVGSYIGYLIGIGCFTIFMFIFSLLIIITI